MSKIYYGVEKTPPDHRPATMIESAKAGQVRRFGLYQIDPMLLGAKIKEEGPKESDYKDKVTRLKGRVAGIIHRHKLANSPVTKEKLVAEHKIALEELKTAIAELEAFRQAPAKTKLSVTLDPKKVKGYHKKKAAAKKARQLKKEAAIKRRNENAKERERLKKENRARIEANKAQRIAIAEQKKKDKEKEKEKKKQEKLAQVIKKNIVVPKNLNIVKNNNQMVKVVTPPSPKKTIVKPPVSFPIKNIKYEKVDLPETQFPVRGLKQEHQKNKKVSNDIVFPIRGINL